MIIIHNTRCSKSREALGLLEKAKCEIEIRNYLTDSLSKKELSELIKKIGCKAEDLVRKEEPIYKELYGNKKLSASEYLNVLVKEPRLLQRPIIIDGDTAIIGRPASLVVDLIKTSGKKRLPKKNIGANH